MYFHYRIHGVLLLVLFFLSIFSSSSSPTSQINSNSVLVALLDSHYTELVELIEKAMLLQTLENTVATHNITIFALNNEALERNLDSDFKQFLLEPVEQWIDFSSFELDSNIQRWYYPRLGYGTYLPPAEENAITALKRALAALNTHLASNTYLVAHSVTLADIIMITNLYFCFTKILVKSFTSQYPHVERYFWTLVNHPNKPRHTLRSL
ncbi:hypothetical protein RYX36_034672 [Vicia faba]